MPKKKQKATYVSSLRQRAEDAEERLNASEKKSLTWLEYSPVCTKIVDLDFNLQYMSAAGVNGLNIDDITEFYGKPYPFDFYPKPFKTLMRMNLKKVKETGEIIEQEGSVNDIDGRELWFHSTIVPVNDDEGRIEYIIVVSADITARKKAEKELKKAHDSLEIRVEERTAGLKKEIAERKRVEEALLEYQKAVEGSEELITAVDRQYVYSLANEAFLRYHCLNRDQVIGRNIVEVIGEEMFRSIIKPNAERCFKGETVDFRMKHIYPGYGERYMQVSNYPLKNNDGEMTGMVIVARDVTVSKLAAEGLKESDEKYRSLVEATSDWIWEVDIEGVYTYTNSKIKDILGYEPEEILGKTPFDFMVPDEQERLSEWFKDTLESHKPFEEIENTNIHKDGRKILLETSGVPIFDTDGKSIGLQRNRSQHHSAQVGRSGPPNSYQHTCREGQRTELPLWYFRSC